MHAKYSFHDTISFITQLRTVLYSTSHLFGCAQFPRLVSSGRGLRKRRRLVALIRIAALGGAPPPQRSRRLVLTLPVSGSLSIATVPSSKTWIIFIKTNDFILYIVCTMYVSRKNFSRDGIFKDRNQFQGIDSANLCSLSPNL
jgi:hypothetical protein